MKYAVTVKGLLAPQHLALVRENGSCISTCFWSIPAASHGSKSSAISSPLTFVSSAVRRQSTDTVCTSSQLLCAIQSLSPGTQNQLRKHTVLTTDLSFIRTCPIEKTAMITKQKLMATWLHFVQYPFPRGSLCYEHDCSVMGTRVMAARLHLQLLHLFAVGVCARNSVSLHLLFSKCKMCLKHLLTLLRALKGCEVSWIDKKLSAASYGGRAQTCPK